MAVRHRAVVDFNHSDYVAHTAAGQTTKPSPSQRVTLRQFVLDSAYQALTGLGSRGT